MERARIRAEKDKHLTTVVLPQSFEVRFVNHNRYGRLIRPGLHGSDDSAMIVPACDWVLFQMLSTAIDVERDREVPLAERPSNLGDRCGRTDRAGEIASTITLTGPDQKGVVASVPSPMYVWQCF